MTEPHPILIPWCEKHQCYCVWLLDDAEGVEHPVCPKCEQEKMQEQESFDNETDALDIDPSTCVYCGSQMHDGYCWASPFGDHLHEDD